MPAFFIADISASDMEKYQSGNYLDVIPDIVSRYGGEYRTRGGATEILEGDWCPKRLVIIEFPSMGDLLAFYNSEEYKPFKELRQRNTDSKIIAIEGV
ncbi:MAG: DUF1330 domain-containing protein [Gammaproteobacteria bacterium]|nr:DUF1330 domain-containing protein [Gammaproteobacteria bacterium]